MEVRVCSHRMKAKAKAKKLRLPFATLQEFDFYSQTRLQRKRRPWTRVSRALSRCRSNLQQGQRILLLKN